jgi:hypothetical protein
MLEDHVESPVTRKQLRSGLAATHIDGSPTGSRLGYKPISIELRLQKLAILTDWMKNAGFGAENLLEGMETCRAALACERHVPYSRGPIGESLVAGSMFIRYIQE